MKKDTKQKRDRCQEKLVGLSLKCPVRRGAARDKERKETASFSACER